MEHERKINIQIVIDEKHYTVHSPTMSGAELKGLAGRDPSYELYLEEKGEDKLILDTQAVELHDGMHFYTVPPASFGLCL